jgi:G3E family GTPase
MTTGQKPASIPVTLIGGFLGAGKTTLLNYILCENHGVRAAVLVNDFGAINIDAKLVVGVEGETVSLANGCVCCTIRDDLVAACLGLLQRPEPPEHLIIEMSGVADPIPVLNTFMETDLGAIFTFSSYLAVVDAEQLPGLQGEMAHLAWRQIRAADIVVLNKLDLVSSDDLANVKQRLHETAPGLRIIEVTHGQVPLELVFEAGCRDPGIRLGGDARDPAGHSERHSFSTCYWINDDALSLPKLRAALESMPESVYRIKGVIHLEELPTFRVILQTVGKRTHIGDDCPWGSEHRRTEIVLIGSRGGFDEEELRRALDACVGTGDDSESPVLRLARKLALAPRSLDHSVTEAEH